MVCQKLLSHPPTSYAPDERTNATLHIKRRFSLTFKSSEYFASIHIVSDFKKLSSAMFEFLHTERQVGESGEDNSYILGAFAKFRNATVSVVMSVCLPVRPSVPPSVGNDSATIYRIS